MEAALELRNVRKGFGQTEIIRGTTPRWTAGDMYSLFPRLKEREHTPASVLSGGEQQMLTLCRSLMGDERILLLRCSHTSGCLQTQEAFNPACG